MRTLLLILGILGACQRLPAEIEYVFIRLTPTMLSSGTLPFLLITNGGDRFGDRVQVKAIPVAKPKEHFHYCAIVLMTKRAGQIDFPHDYWNRNLRSSEAHPVDSVPREKVDFAFVEVGTEVDPSEWRPGEQNRTNHYYCPLSELLKQ